MNVKYFYSFLAVLVLALIAWVGCDLLGLQMLFGVILPYIAVVAFFVGFFLRMMDWARSTVPFQIPTTAGQAKSLPWIKTNAIDSPFTTGGVVARMFFEVVTFRSLFRNTRMRVNPDGRISYDIEIWLWLFALAFHYTFFVVILRHARFFLEPLPLPFEILEKIDTFVQIGHPIISMSSFALLGAVLFLFIRRVYLPNIRMISLASDYFPLFLIFGIAFTGIFMRYFAKIDVTAAKELILWPGVFQLAVTGEDAGDRQHFLYPRVFCLRAAGLFPLEQADAHGRYLPEPDTQHGQQYPRCSPREPVELPGKCPYL